MSSQKPPSSAEAPTWTPAAGSPHGQMTPFYPVYQTLAPQQQSPFPQPLQQPPQQHHQPSAKGQLAPNGEPATEVCKLFAKGRACTYGNRCRFLHLDPGDPATTHFLSQKRPTTPPAPPAESPAGSLSATVPGRSALSLNPSKRDKPG